jgi:hypothetical protein
MFSCEDRWDPVFIILRPSQVLISAARARARAHMHARGVWTGRCKCQVLVEFKDVCAGNARRLVFALALNLADAPVNKRAA